MSVQVTLIFGICGACRREELANVKVEDIKHHVDMILVNIPNTKTKIPRSFTIDGEFYATVMKYAALRPQKASSDRFFLNYQKGKCTVQNIGKNKFDKMPNTIPTYLNLPDPHPYTGHSFIRTSATLLADSGADITTLKRHGGWKSTTVAEGLYFKIIKNCISTVIYIVDIRFIKSFVIN